MRFALEFHDSEIRDVVASARHDAVRFAAACVRDPQGNRGWLTGVTLALADATLAGDPALAFGRLSEGRLRQDGRDVVRPALPGTLAGALAADAAVRQRHAADRAAGARSPRACRTTPFHRGSSC